MPWVIAVLLASSLLNAAYFLPVLYRVWFQPRTEAWPGEHIPMQNGRETAWLLLVPPLVTAVATVLVGLFAASAMSPLNWVKLIADREYLYWLP